MISLNVVILNHAPRLHLCINFCINYCFDISAVVVAAYPNFRAVLLQLYFHPFGINSMLYRRIKCRSQTTQTNMTANLCKGCQ